MRLAMKLMIGVSVLLGVIPLVVEAQPAGMRRVGVLAQDLQPGLLETFSDELRQLGYAEGKTLALEVRNAAGRDDRLPAQAEDLVRRKVEVVAVNTPAALAASKATSTIPIVLMRVADPVGQGLVASLARPGGNVTGLNFMPDELGAKGIQLLHEMLPGITRVAALYWADNPGALFVVTETERRSTQLGLHFLRLPVRGPAEFPGAFETAKRARMEALFVMDDGAMTKRRKEVVELALRHSMAVVEILRKRAASSPTGRARPPATDGAPSTWTVS